MNKFTEIVKLTALALITAGGISTSKGATPGDFWYFGINAGLDFSGGAPVAIAGGQIFTFEGSASISDSSGNLLFYTDGVSVYNKDHDKMEPNGHALNGDSDSTQSGIAIPKPGDSNTYFLFTVPPQSKATGGGLDYYEIDMTGDGGLGSIDTNENRLFDDASEQLTAVKHNNGTDFWVIARARNSNTIKSFLVSAAGVSTTPVDSNVGLTLDGLNRAERGYLKASPDGGKIAMAFTAEGNAQLYDFNNATGEISNAVTLNPVGENHYGIEFSMDGANCTFPAKVIPILEVDRLSNMT